MRGQGATEYLVLLAVVLILAIVTIALLGFFPGTAGDARITESRAYWSGVASPLSIEDAQPLRTGTSGAVCDAIATRGVRIVLQNTQTSTLFLTGINFGGSAVPAFCNAGSVTAATLIPIDPGGTAAIDAVIGLGYCATTGQTTDVPIKLSYNTQYLSGQVQTGAKNLVYRC
ncbi:MAG: hypothetical protein QW568_01145 [Candidatus Anstonellaceae archaeon]